MKPWIFQLILALFFLTDSSATEIELPWVKEIKEEEVSTNEKIFTFEDAHNTTSNLFPMIITFNNPVSDIQSPLIAEMRNSWQWILTLNDTNSIDNPLSFRITGEEKDVKILNIRVGDQMIYNDCTIKGSPDETPEISCVQQVTHLKISENETSFSFPDFETNPQDLFPLRICFSSPVTNIESPLVISKMLKSREWILSLKDEESLTNSSLAEPFAFKALHDKGGENINTTRIINIIKGDFLIYQESESHGEECVNTDPFSVSPNTGTITHCPLTWDGGRKFEITIPIYRNIYHGYSVDVYFTEPVTDITINDTSFKIIKSTPTHWSFLNETMELECNRSVEISFEITSNTTSDIKALQLHERSIYRNVEGTTEEDEYLEKAVRADCNSFITIYAKPWFGTEKGVGLNISVTLKSRNVMGVVADIIFEDKIEKLKTWKHTPIKISDNYWRVANAGHWIDGDGKFYFTFIPIYFHHYHVKIIGIKVNNEIFCGLAAPPVYIEDERDISKMTNTSTAEGRMKSHLKKLNAMHHRMLSATIVIAFTIFFSLIIPCILVWAMKQKNNAEQDTMYMYTEPVPAKPLQPAPISDPYDDTYHTIYEPTTTNDIYSTHL